MPASYRGSFPPSIILSTGRFSIGGVVSDALAVPAAAGWGVANSALFMPVRVPWPVVVKRLYWVNGTTGDTCDIGLYQADGTKIVSSGATAQSGASVPQFADITDQDLGPGFYYIGFADNNAAAGTFLQCSLTSVSVMRAAGILYQASSATLPSPATFATVATHVRFPVIGMEITRAI